MGPHHGYYKEMKTTLQTKVDVRDLNGSIAVDLSIFLYTLCHTFPSKQLLHQLPPTKLTFIRDYFIRFDSFAMRNGLVYEYYLDGLSHDLKLASLSRKKDNDTFKIKLAALRRDPSATVDDLKKLHNEPGSTVMSRSDIDAYIIDCLTELGIAFHRSFTEADAAIAEAVKSGRHRYAYSTDGDFLALGVPEIITEINMTKGTALLVTLKDDDTETWLKLSRDVLGAASVDEDALCLDRHWMIVLSNLAGNDFIPGLKGVGWIRAVNMLREAMIQGLPGLTLLLNDICATKEYNPEYSDRCNGPCTDYPVRFWRAYFIHLHPPVIRIEQSVDGERLTKYTLEPLHPFGYMSEYNRGSNGWEDDRMLGFSPEAMQRPYLGRLEEFVQGRFSRLRDGEGNLVTIDAVRLKQPCSAIDPAVLLPWGSDLDVRAVLPKFQHMQSLRRFLSARGIAANAIDAANNGDQDLVQAAEGVLRLWVSNGHEDEPAVLSASVHDQIYGDGDTADLAAMLAEVGIA